MSGTTDFTKLMDSSTEEDWFAANSSTSGPSLEDFLATDPSDLPFLQGSTATNEDLIRYKLFADNWGSIEHLQQVRNQDFLVLSVAAVVVAATMFFIGPTNQQHVFTPCLIVTDLFESGILSVVQK